MKATSRNIYAFYEPEIMPALKLELGFAVVLVQHTSKAIITGAKRISDIARAADCVRELLKAHGVEANT